MTAELCILSSRESILPHVKHIQPLWYGGNPLKQLKVLLSACVLFLLVTAAHGQQLDIAFGAGTISSPASTPATATQFFKQSLSGGAFLAFSGDALIKGNLGFQGEVAWRASRNLYAGVLPYRPVFWDFNAIYAPRFNRFLGAELMAGIGAESTRFYTGPNYSYFGGYTNYTSRSKFMGDFGGGIRLYPVGNFFIRPEARLYLIHGNDQFFSSGRALRYGMSIGYTFGGKMF